jgi:cytochrome c-type biogenesis protein
VSAFTLTHTVLLPVGLGLFGFLEPCSIGTTLLFTKLLEGRSTADKFVQVGVFAVTRAVFIGLLGILAVVAGSVFLGLQRAAWGVLGAGYLLLGAMYLHGRARLLMVSLGSRFLRGPAIRHSAVLGVIFGLNIPACAAPLLLVLLGSAAAGGAGGASIAAGFWSLALFGLALSLPLMIVAPFRAGSRALDRLASLSRRLPHWTGLLLIALGLWSIYFSALPLERGNQ